MSLYRRWLDPLRSRWYSTRPKRQAQLPIDKGISIYLRLDDVYSYLAVQELEQLEQILIDAMRPLKIILSDVAAPPPSSMSAEAWQNYCFKDARILAMQHGFAFDDVPELPAAEAIAQARLILERTPLQSGDFLYLLEDVFHMLWNQQYHKLELLYQLALQQPLPTPDQQLRFSRVPVLTAYFEFGERHYQAVDDLLRLTRRLQQQKLLTSAPIFLINHIEWREHLIQDAGSLNEIQALNPALTLYVALEDPITWLLLQYIQEELASFYNIQLLIQPLPYLGRDEFDWSLAMRLSRRTEVSFTPFCRPDAAAVMVMAQAFYAAAPDQQLPLLLDLLRAVWTQGRDVNYAPHLQPILQPYQLGPKPSAAQVSERLAANQQACEQLAQPNLPVMILQVDGQQYVFNSLYRVWLIESIFSRVLARRYREQQDHQRRRHVQHGPAPATPAVMPDT